MIAYYVLGTGVFLIFISLISTVFIIANAKKKNMSNIEEKTTLDENNSLIQSLDIHTGDTTQLKHSIENIGSELDELISQLKEKENEIKRLVSKARKWNFELSDPVFAEILEKKIAYQEASNFVHRLYKEHAVASAPDEKEEGNLSHEDTKRENEEPVLLQSKLPGKYEMILNLAREGLTVPEIARQLNMGHREVELVVKMNKKEADTHA